MATGCAAFLSRSHQRSLEEVIESRGVDPQDVVYPDRLTKEMRKWLRLRFPRQPRSEYGAYQLLEALEGANGLDLEYESGFTGTAQDVFETRKYNCLSFSHLFLAMAREIGVDAHYLNVDRIQRFRRSGDVVLVSGHVTVGFGIGPNRRVLEYRVGPPADYKTATPISDLTAMALFYTNRGAELIQQGRYEEAVEWLVIGTRLDPALPGTWLNLGVARRRSGDLDGAEKSYLKSIALDDTFFPAYRNLASLYQLRGKGEVAAELFAVLDRRGNRNPYAFLALGDQSLESGRTAEAEQYYRRALRLSTDRADAQAALGNLALEKGRLEQAQQWLEEARASNPESERVEELEERIAPSGAPAEPAGPAMHIDQGAVD